MYNRLKELGVPVVITRDQDEYLPKDKRIDRIKELKRGYQNTLLVSNHINAGGEKGSCSKITFFEIIYGVC